MNFYTRIGNDALDICFLLVQWCPSSGPRAEWKENALRAQQMKKVSLKSIYEAILYGDAKYHASVKK